MKMRLGVAVVVAGLAALTPSLSAQWPAFKHSRARRGRPAVAAVKLDAPAPKTADGKPDLSGLWGD